MVLEVEKLGFGLCAKPPNQKGEALDLQSQESKTQINTLLKWGTASCWGPLRVTNMSRDCSHKPPSLMDSSRSHIARSWAQPVKTKATKTTHPYLGSRRKASCVPQRR